MAFWTNRFRFFLLLIFFWYNMCLQLIYRNLVFTLPAMIDHDFFERTSGAAVVNVANNTCAPPDREVAEDIQSGPYRWDDYTQSLFLSLEAVGILIGTMSAIFLYNYCFMRPVVTICLIWGGLLNIFAPEIVGGGGAYGLAISRFANGIYVGLVQPTPNLACALWFTEDEKNVALTFAYLGCNVGTMYFALAGVISLNYGWQANFRIPGFISLVCGIFFLIFFTDDPGENIFISEEETKLLKRPRIRPVTSTSPVNEQSKNNKDKHLGRYRIVTAITNIQIARHRAKKKAPLMEALTYLPIWAVLMGSFGVSWYLESVVVYTQFYLIEMHKFSLGRTSFLNSM